MQLTPNAIKNLQLCDNDKRLKFKTQWQTIRMKIRCIYAWALVFVFSFLIGTIQMEETTLLI